MFPARVRSAAFGGAGFRTITRDGGTASGQTAYESPQWRDDDLDDQINDPGQDAAGDRNFPVCYMRGSPLTIQTVAIGVEAGNAPLPSFTVAGAGGPFRLEAPASPVAGGVAAGPITATAVQQGSSAAFPNTVGVQTLGLSWQLKWSRDGRHADTQVGWSGTKVYRTAAAPATQPLFETLLHLGCRAASGLTGDDEPALVDAIWSEFADRDVRRTDGARLGYYRGITCNADCPMNFTTASLLRDTNGRCGAWADLLVDVLRAQGVLTVSIIGVFPDPDVLPLNCQTPAGRGPLLMLVKNYTFVGQGGSGCNFYPFRFNHACPGLGGTWLQVDVFDQPGAAAQDNADPVSAFFDHALVKHGGKYYDPSYGTGPFTSVGAFEQASLAGYGEVAIENQNGWVWGARKDDPAVNEIKGTPQPPNPR